MIGDQPGTGARNTDIRRKIKWMAVGTAVVLVAVAAYMAIAQIRQAQTEEAAANLLRSYFSLVGADVAENPARRMVCEKWQDRYADVGLIAVPTGAVEGFDSLAEPGARYEVIRVHASGGGAVGYITVTRANPMSSFDAMIWLRNDGVWKICL